MTKFLVVFGLMIGMFVAEKAKADSCEYELVTRRGLVIDRIHVGSRYMTRYDACKEADRECRAEKKYRERLNRRGRKGLSCQKVRVRRPERRGRRVVTRSCTYLFDRKNPRRQDNHYTATETGVAGTGVKARACEKALEMCLVKDIFYKGTCVRLD